MAYSDKIIADIKILRADIHALDTKIESCRNADLQEKLIDQVLDMSRNLEVLEDLLPRVLAEERYRALEADDELDLV